VKPVNRANQNKGGIIVNEKKMGSSGPWGVTAFATTSFMLGVYNAGLLHGGGMPVVLDMALIFGGLMQVICGVLEIVGGNTFVGSVFGTFGPLWITFAAFQLWFAPMVPKADIPSAVALFLTVFAVPTFYFLIAALKTDWVLVIVVLLILITLVLMALSAGLGNPGLNVVAGWLTMIFAVGAWYHAAAQLLAATWGKEVLPVGRIVK
jgi:succinate-acetate transporter protein